MSDNRFTSCIPALMNPCSARRKPDFPDTPLTHALRRGNPWLLRRRLDGQRET